MAKQKKEKLNEKEIEKKLIDLKIELLKQNQKRRGIKKEIAKLLTMKNKFKITKSKEGSK